MSLRQLGGIGMCLIGGVALGQTPAPDAWQTLLRSGQPAPGTPHLVTPGWVSLRVAGDGHFQAIVGVRPPNTSTDVVAIIHGGPGTPLTTLGYVTQYAPDYEDRMFEQLGEGVVGVDGVVAFQGRMLGWTPGEATYQYTVWYWDGVGRERLAMRNTPAPGLAAGAMFGTNSLQDAGGQIAGIDSEGRVLAVYGVYGGPFAQGSSVYWHGQPGSLTPVAYPGVPVSGSTPLVNPGTPWLALNGRAYFADDMRVVTWASGVMTQVMAPGQPAPGIPGRTLINYVEPVDVSSNGTLLLHGFLSPATGAPVNERALWSSDGTGTPALLLRAGTPLADRPAAQIGSPSAHQINAQGRVLFTTNLTGAMIGEAMCITSPSGPELIMRRNQLLPEGGGNFLNAGTNYAINDAGQVAFRSAFFNQDSGVYGWTSQMGLFLMLRTGSTLTLDDGVTRTVSTVTMGERNEQRSDRQATGLLDDGTLILGVRFTDGTSAIVSARFPEPCSAADVGRNGGMSGADLRLDKN